MMDDDRLRYYLDRIREIAKLDEDEALENVSSLLQEFYEGSWTLESAKAELERVRQEASGMGDIIRRGVPLDGWRARELRRSADQLGSRWPESIRSQFAGDLNETRHLAYDAADRAEFKACTDTIDQCSSELLINAQQVLRVIRDLVDAEESLKRQERLTPDLQAQLRAAKQRCARYRAQKKLDEAEVALAGDNQRKERKLRAEAEVLLKQDWYQVFPDDPSPPSSSQAR
ncbi:MAG TPA: hypothetical protein VM166_03885 [Gemmatimonadaceae bacterium]|nr:hypothetical protein [Gemmatimonadaceae bacterium]